MNQQPTLIFSHVEGCECVLLLLLYTRLKAVSHRCENVAKDRNTRDYLA